MTLREINLVPTELIQKKHLTSHILFWSGCLVIILCMIFGFYFYQVHLVLTEKRPTTTIEDMHTQLGSTVQEITQTQQEIERLRIQESFLKHLARNQPFSTLLLRLSEIMNNQTWLKKLTIDTGTDEKEHIEMQLYGYSLSNEDLGNFLTQLSNDRLFQEVALKYAHETEIMQSSEKRKVRAKVVDFHINSKIPRS